MARLARLALLPLAFVFVAASASAGTWYVRRNAGPGGNGLSWTTALQRVQDALALAQNGDQVWVAYGTYRPGAFSSPNTSTFLVPAGVALYGGFFGNETSLAQRDWTVNLTVLSGDLHLDDTPNFGNRSDNCHSVVTVDHLYGSPAPTIDGFTIRGGYGQFGGGIHSTGGVSLHLAHLVVCDNWASLRGGGIYCEDGDLDADACEIRGNQAGNAGGVYMLGGALYAFSCLVQGNLAFGSPFGSGGAAITFQDANGWLRQCTVARNQGMNVGGIVSCCAFNGLTLDNSILWGNLGSSGSTAADQLQVFSQIAIRSTDVQGDAQHLGLDPEFEDPLGPDGFAGTGDESFRLRCTSPLIDRGDNSLLTASMQLDLDGRARRADDPALPDLGLGTAPVVDLGAYEFVCACDDVQRYCTALPNSTGAPASIDWSGSTSLFADALTVSASGAPPLKTGLFFYGATQLSVPWGDGLRCVGGSLQRLTVLQTDASGQATLPLALTLPPFASGPHAVLPGSVWNFQFLFRDPLGGPNGWNTTDALEIHFCP